MRLLLVSILFTLLSPMLQGQNLLSNPSFEDTVSGLPPTVKYSQYKYKQSPVKGWYQPTGGTPDFFNSDLSTVGKHISVHTARTGEGRIGFIGDNGSNKRSEREKDTANHYKDNDHYKEYIAAKFVRPMVKDSLYEVKFYIVHDKRSNYISSNIGAYISDTAILNSWPFTCLEYVPQISLANRGDVIPKTHWISVHGLYKAHGGEQYITFGSFGREDPIAIEQIPIELQQKEIFELELFRYSSYYYIDDFSVVNVADTAYYNKLHSNNEKSVVNNFVFLLDISTSMVNANYIADMKRGITSMLDRLNAYDQLTLLTFDVKGKVIFEKYKIGEREKIINALDQIKPGGRSNINDGLKLSCEMMEKTWIRRGNNTIVITTDGTFTIDKSRIDEVTKLAGEKEVTVNVIQFGGIESKELKKLSIKCKGTYQQTAHKVEEILIGQIKQPKPVGDYTKGKMK